MINTALVWFRYDLRLSDNPALWAAVASGRRIIPVFIDWPAQERPWSPGSASHWWLQLSLEALDRSLRQRGSRLLIRRGPAQVELVRLARETNARTVYWNRRYEPVAIELDRRVGDVLERNGIEGVGLEGTLLHHPETILTRQGSPYRIFTAFWKNARREPAPMALSDAPQRLNALPRSLNGVDARELKRVSGGNGGPPGWVPGEAAAKGRLRDFLKVALADYPRQRELPASPGTSRLSPHLHFGEIAPLRILTEVRREATRSNGPRQAAEEFLRQLYWREFAHYVLHHFPHTAEHPLDERFEHFAWSGNPRLLAAWRQGMTGFPMVDAAMRELLETGWMHNRSRMIAASLLTKNMRIHWLEGAKWFWERLVDADLANNSFGWQWTAGCGADAAPFFRVFNPTRQGERYDAAGHYIRRWVPELSALPNRWIHHPWEAPQGVLAKAEIGLGRNYPFPVVRFAATREQALLAYRKLPKRGSRSAR